MDHNQYSWQEKSEYLSYISWGNASDRAVQTYADFYAQLGYSSIQLGLNTSTLKGYNQLFADQAFWNDAERQIYTEIMARNTLTIERSDSPSKTLETTDLVFKTSDGYIDVGDGCWRRIVLMTTLRYWWRFWPFWSPISTILLHKFRAPKFTNRHQL